MMIPQVDFPGSVDGAGEGDGSGGRLVSADGRSLPLRAVSLRADARGGVARVVLEQRFENVYDEPLHVTYLMPLPHDGAVSGYAFTLGARRVVGEVDRKQKARQRFEKALSEGRTAALVEQERSSLFTQELGNVPGKTTIVAELTIDQRLTWLDEGAWEWRFPTAAGPRYTGGPGRVADAARTEIAVADAPLPVRLALSLAVRDANARPESPHHALHVAEVGGRVEVGFREDGGVRLDRDVVVRWKATNDKIGLALDIGRPRAAEATYGLLSIVPPEAGRLVARGRDLILLLDTSGSMGGEPLEQSKRVCRALIETLTEHDHLEMIEFSTAARRWKKGAVAATAANRQDALAWLDRLSAGGGTEMVAGVLEALTPLGSESQRQVVLLTDGYIGFETQVVKAVKDRLPAGSRLHVVGVGSSVNRSLTGPTARAGRGLETVIGIGEDAEKPARRLVARTNAPLVTDVELSGDALVEAAPARLPDLYAGAPALAAVKLRPGTLIVRGRTAEGTWEDRVKVGSIEAGQGNLAAATLFAREKVEDLELLRAAGGNAEELDGEIEALGLEHQISTRLTTWLAVSSEVTVDPTQPTRREIVPQELPHGVSAEGLGLRKRVMAAPAMATVMAPAPMMAAPAGMPMAPPAPVAPGGRVPVMKGGFTGKVEAVKGFFKKLSERDEDDEQEGAGEAAPEEKKREEAPRKARAAKPAKSVLRRRLRARLRLRQGREWLVEIQVDAAALPWNPPKEVEIHFADGLVVQASVDRTKTTAAGNVAAGLTVRLALILPADPGAGAVTHIECGELDLELHA